MAGPVGESPHLPELLGERHVTISPAVLGDLLVQVEPYNGTDNEVGTAVFPTLTAVLFGF
jgi:hypothetical protein